jgi:uncharacterized protein YciI
MHTILFYDFADDYLTQRAPYRAEHLALVHAAFERGEVALAGALADPADGALLVFRGTSPEAAEAFAKADPYVIHGLVTTWRTRRWNTVVGDGASMP